MFGSRSGSCPFGAFLAPNAYVRTWSPRAMLLLLLLKPLIDGEAGEPTTTRFGVVVAAPTKYGNPARDKADIVLRDVVVVVDAINGDDAMMRLMRVVVEEVVVVVFNKNDMKLSKSEENATERDKKFENFGGKLSKTRIKQT
jgi:hypothetical protein